MSELSEKEREKRRNIGLSASWAAKLRSAEKKLNVAMTALETIKKPDDSNLLVPAKQIASEALTKIRGMR